MESVQDVNMRTEEDVIMALARGYCHGCSREVAAKEVEPDEFACPLCFEVGIVECPLEGFERWSGEWRAEYADGSRSGFSISETGELSMTSGASSSPLPSVRMEWAASDVLAHSPGGADENEALRPQVFMFRVRGHRLHATEYLRLEADGSLAVRLILDAQDGGSERSIREGRATRPPPPPVAPNPAPLLMNGLDINNVLSNFVSGFTEGMQANNQNPGAPQGFEGLVSAMDAGFQRLASDASGLSEQQRQHIASQGQHVSQMFARLADGHHALPIMQLGMNGPFDFGFDQFPFPGAVLGGNDARERERTGVPEVLARRFCEEHEIEALPEGVEKGEDGWMCPICYLDADAGKLVMLCEGDAKEGRNSHVYHQHCAVNWLSRQNTCPFCRRSPVVPPAPPPPLPTPQMFFPQFAMPPGQLPHEMVPGQQAHQDISSASDVSDDEDL